MPDCSIPPLPVLTPLSRLQLDRIHGATLRILETTGIWIECSELAELARHHGLKVDGQTVFFSGDQVASALSATPGAFTLLARNPARTVHFDLETSVLGLGRSAPFVMPPKGQRRPPLASDYVDFIKLGQALDSVQLTGQLVYPADIPQNRIYSFMMAAMVRYSDKPYGLIHPSDLELLGPAFGMDIPELKRRTDLGTALGQTTVNTLSPLAMSRDQGELLMVMAEHGIPISVSPTPAAGSTGPCSLLGTLVLNNAENLGTLVLIQLVRPGLPVFYGTFPSSSDMRTMGATYGGPEARKMEVAAAQIARSYGLLTRGNVGLNDSQELDFQAGAEAMFNFVTAFEQRISHLPGMGISASFAAASREKLVLDSDLAGYARHFVKPFEDEPLDTVTDLICETGSRGNYLTCHHTYSRFKTVLHHPDLLSRTSHDKWLARGKNLCDQACERSDHLLESYVTPALDRSLERHLSTFL